MNTSKYRYLDTPLTRGYDSGKSIYILAKELVLDLIRLSIG
jgi:hypothetical protein